MADRVEKLTISVPKNLIETADEIARENKTSRSKVISSCLQELAERRLCAEMKEGYKALAKENLRFAKDAIHATNEISPDWEES
jgi:metal-responsive CopG/Arc/MetJ family transcriptional regulator